MVWRKKVLFVIVRDRKEKYKAGIKMERQIKEILEKTSFWKRLEEEEKELVQKGARLVEYRAGESVYSGTRECLGALLIQKGSLRTYLLSDEGKEVTMYRLFEGDTCVLAASCVLSAITFDVEIEAQTDCQALLIPAWILSRLTEQNVYAENFIYKETAKRFSDVVEALQQLMFLSLTQRIASFLLDESAKRKSSSIAMTHEEIAKVIGSAREAVSRSLKQMAKAGYISLNRGEIQIERKEELYRLL